MNCKMKKYEKIMFLDQLQKNYLLYHHNLR